MANKRKNNKRTEAHTLAVVIEDSSYTDENIVRGDSHVTRRETVNISSDKLAANLAQVCFHSQDCIRRHS